MLDAIHFTKRDTLETQLQGRHLHREMLKASAGFGVGARRDWPEEAALRCAPIATGHWGCGAFNRHKGLKCLLQWEAASAAQRGLRYYCFDDEDFHAETRKRTSIQNARSQKLARIFFFFTKAT